MTDSIVLKYGYCDECGTYGIARFFHDGSFISIVYPCWHKGLDIPSRDKILKAMKDKEVSP